MASLKSALLGSVWGAFEGESLTALTGSLAKVTTTDAVQGLVSDGPDAAPA
jgi:hypothetical protein